MGYNNLNGTDGRIDEAISELMELAHECSNSDWDGCNLLTISKIALRRAAQFVRALPEDFPMPEFAPEPDGAISLDWIQSKMVKPSAFLPNPN